MQHWSMRGWFDLAFLVVTPKLLLMDKAITASEANQRFSEMLRDVSEGNTFTVTSRGRPVARVTPFDREAQRRKIRDLLAFVEKLPVRYAGSWTRDDLYE